MVSPDTEAEIHSPPVPARPEFSLFYFGSEADERSEDKYRLLIEGARFADEHGFAGVWTPERHFASVGGLYPNPALTSAALAMVTRRIQIRAGSVVLPLHHPIRVAEEWSVVDNLSRGRVAISFASGWHTNDFALAPDHFAGRKEVMFQGIETIRRLWRGEAVPARNGAGDSIAVTIFPKPVQRALPIWITSSGQADTFRMAGELGSNLLTHLFGQALADLTKRIELYRGAWRHAGHTGHGRVCVMLHTFIWREGAAAREKARGPLRQYLRTYRKFSQTTAAPIPEAELEVLLDNAVDRYLDSSGLFGTPEQAQRLVEKLMAAGVDEIACLIDFGIDADSVLASLPYLDELRRRCQAPERAAAERSGNGAPHQPLRSLGSSSDNSDYLRTSLAAAACVEDAKERVLSQLRTLFARLSGSSPAALSKGRTFLELGFESLLLTQASRSIEQQLNVAIPFRQFFEGADTLERLADYIEQRLRPEKTVTSGAPPPGSGSAERSALLSPPPFRPSAPEPRASFKVDLAAQAGRIENQARRLRESFGIKDLPPGSKRGLDDLCAAYIREYFEACGLSTAPGRRYEMKELRTALRLRPVYERLLSYMLNLLAEDGMIRRDENGLEWLPVSGSRPAAGALHERLLEQYPSFAGLLEMLRHCAAHYREALAGDILGASVLLPNGRHDFLRNRLQDYTDQHKHVRVYEHAAKDLVLRLTTQAPLRILEVGGGGGELTWQLVPELAGRNCQYHFSDIGRTFVRTAREEAARRGLDFMSFGVLDIARAPVRQGYQPHTFEMILAVNVIHATPRVEETLTHLRHLLVPGGLICLVELTKYERWDNFIIGLAEGWWLFEDADRTDSPLLRLEQWENVFRRAGYAAVSASPANPDERALTDAGLVLAQAP